MNILAGFSAKVPAVLQGGCCHVLLLLGRGFSQIHDSTGGRQAVNHG